MQTILLTGTRITCSSSMPGGSVESRPTRYQTSSLPPEFCHGSRTSTLVAPCNLSIKSLPCGMAELSAPAPPVRLLPSLRQESKIIAAAITNGTSFVTANLLLSGYLSRKGSRPAGRNGKPPEEGPGVQLATAPEIHPCILLLKPPFRQSHRS